MANEPHINDCSRCGEDAICIHISKGYSVRMRRQSKCKNYGKANHSTCHTELCPTKEEAIQTWNTLNKENMTPINSMIDAAVKCVVCKAPLSVKCGCKIPKSPGTLADEMFTELNEKTPHILDLATMIITVREIADRYERLVEGEYEKYGTK